jgi:hypothetical protein
MLRCTPLELKIAILIPAGLPTQSSSEWSHLMARQADAFPATMLTSQHGIREFHSGPKYGRIEIGDHKLTKIDRSRDLATQEILENSIA